MASGITLGPGTLIFVDLANGEDFSAPVIPAAYAEIDEVDKVINKLETTELEATVTIYDIDINRLTWLGLIHGRKVTNNWLKMHGGVMTRKTKRS